LSKLPIVVVHKETSMKKMTFAFVCALAVVSLGACKKKGGGGAGEAMAKMSEFKDEMCKCKEAKCAQDVSDKMTKWSQDQAGKQKEPAKMSDADQKKAQSIGEEMGKCMQTAMGAPAAAPAAGAAPAAAGGDLPAECAEYKAAVEKLATCDKLPAASRAALKKSFDDASASWASMPAEQKAGLSTSCKAGTEAVMSSAKTPCGW